jgi:hypothetical protein
VKKQIKDLPKPSTPPKAKGLKTADLDKVVGGAAAKTDEGGVEPGS